jgi:hypothetical protein
MTTKAQKLASLGRAAAAITFTRNNNRQIQARNGRQASTQSVTTQPRCVACLKVPLLFLCTLAFLAFTASSAFASGGGETPWWEVSTSSRPTDLPPGATGHIVVQVVNAGDAAVDGANSPVVISDKLPAGLKATAIIGKANSDEYKPGNLPGRRGQVSCLALPALSCSWAGPEPLQPYEQLTVVITVEVEGAASGAVNEASVTGGEAYRCVKESGGRFLSSFCEVGEEAEGGPGSYEGRFEGAVLADSQQHPLTIAGSSSETTPFGAEGYGLTEENQGGTVDTQAGSHPFQLDNTLAFNQSALTDTPPALVKDVNVKLPPGLIGNPTILPQCDEADFSDVRIDQTNLCPAETAVGVAIVDVHLPNFPFVEETPYPVPIFNLVPAPGEPARFGFEVHRVPVLIDTSVRTGGDYGIDARVANVSQAAVFLTSRLIFWGVPGDSRHDEARGWSCIIGGAWSEEELPPCKAQEESQPPPYLTLPTSCTGPLQTSVEVDSWKDPTPLAFGPNEATESLVGCKRLPFAASLEAAPDVQQASSSSGLTVKIHVPQEASLNGTGIAGADVRDTTVTLPAGVALNPSGAGGLEACSNGQIGFTGVGELNGAGEPGVKTPTFTPSLPEPVQPGTNLGALGFCSNASKIGKVKIKTPLLKGELEGSVYLAAQDENPFSSLIAMYIVAEEPVSGVLVKLPGSVSLNPATGQITSTFADTPQVPFENLTLEFFGGERAPLATPSRCGPYTTAASFTPWSGNAAVPVSSTFDITSGPNGAPCPGAVLPFSPSLTGGALNINAGAFSPFTLTMTRSDGEQNMQSVEAHLPPGLSGILANVELCPEPQANEGTCGPNSLIGETTVSVGVGGDPYTVTGGKFYLTGPYNGTGACTVEPSRAGSSSSGCAPFGITFEVPAKAGPFDLANTPGNHPACDCILVRGKIEINPLTTALTITSNPPGTPDAIPTSIEGIPLQIQHINATTTRGNFQFNPTNCNKMEVTGTIHSSEGATDTIGVPFQVTNCKNLAFAPKFAVSTPGHTSKADGAGLTAKLSYPTAAQGTQADIKAVKVDLPKQLPSRLTTLQKACTDKQFETNPANCPKASKIGFAKVTTPLLPVPLEGPAIFVSHGGEAFPSLTMVLQGYGVTVDLVGTTNISHAGITSTTFKTVPDVPFNTFTLTLGQGPYSALAANLPTKDKGSFCGQKLAMPTAFVAQNGVEIHESTKLSVSGCPKTKKAKKAKRKSKKKGAKKK